MNNATISSSYQELNVILGSTHNNISVTEKLSEKKGLFLVIMSYLQSIEYIICFLANALTIVSVVKFDYLHKKSTNLLILSLSTADGILGK